jgi:hypothetical protein
MPLQWTSPVHHFLAGCNNGNKEAEIEDYMFHRMNVGEITIPGRHITFEIILIIKSRHGFIMDFIAQSVSYARFTRYPNLD